MRDIPDTERQAVEPDTKEVFSVSQLHDWVTLVFTLMECALVEFTHDYECRLHSTAGRLIRTQYIATDDLGEHF